ncbi:glycosyltransferase involved in cell wall biosynthesis [Natrinema hispanicum]|uniref:Glycosyltransferase involved in cell wall biosynthesis n=1 Tax=Natrinema hispanicum TaxID=392421 RepID=A0A482Y6Y2_9EURY|nr:glycosyltransferase family 2 protein [Natrinema hispanicum]RZV10893.1 glycosyltransferase involved in cell wall biosynthesis [Natrinema hispanicum]
MVGVTNLLLAGIAVAILGWGFERYRTRFVKSDLLIAGVLAFGILVFVMLPGVYDSVGNVLDIEQRFVLLSLLAHLVTLAIILYLLATIRDTNACFSDLVRNLSAEQAPQTDGGKRTIFIVIPAYNEGETIRSVVESLPETIRGYAVQPVVVSDGSADDTAANAEYNGTIVVEHPVNQGQGGALKTGFQIALDRGASIVVTMDGDGQHPVDGLEQLVAPVIEDKADYVMGSRYKGEDYSGNGLVRESGIQVFTRLINVLTKSDITDCTNGFRAIRASGLEDMELTEERFSAPELIIEARKNGMRIQEIPITIEERQAGETKKPQLMYAVGLTRTIFTTWIR